MKILLKQFIKDIIQELTYVPKRQRVEPSRLPAGTLTTVLGLAACLVLFCATSFAWITRDVGTSSQLDIAEYGMIIVAPDDTTVTEYTFPLTAGDNHTFTLTATGTASTGYCLVYVDDVLLGHTDQVSPNDANPTSITLTITAATGKTVRFQPLWGTHPDNPGTSLFSLLSSDRTETMYHSNTPHLVYEIPFGAKLEDIAAYYFPAEADKGVEYICIYNGIDKLPDEGKTIRIPFVTAHPNGKPYAPTLYPLGGYTVVEGDTLETVAAKLGVTAEMLTAAGIKAEMLLPGAVITVKAADDADSMEYYATGVTITIKAPDSDKLNHYYTSGGVQDGTATLAPGSDADDMNHYYSSGPVTDGEVTPAPDDDADDSDYYPDSSVTDGEVSPAPGGNDDADDSDYYPDSFVTDGEVAPPPGDDDDAGDADEPDEDSGNSDADDGDYYSSGDVQDGTVTPTA